MRDVWVSGAYDVRDSKPVRGAWLCPLLSVCSLIKRAKAISTNDGLRIGCAMAVLSALSSLGGGLIIRMPKYPAPRWVANPKRPVPLPNLMYQILYKTEVHPRTEGHSIVTVQSDGGYYDGQLSTLPTRGGVSKTCTS